MKRTLLIVLAITLLSVPALADTVTLKWNAATGATSYNIYQSTDNRATWTKVASGITTTTTTLSNVPATGLVFFRASAVSGTMETVTYWAGAWYDGTQVPPAAPMGTGIQ